MNDLASARLLAPNFISPHVAESILELVHGDDPHKATREFAEAEFDRDHPAPNRAASIASEQEALAADKLERDRLVANRNATEPLRAEATNAANFKRPASVALGLLAMALFLTFDPMGMVYVATTYVAASPVLDIYAGNMLRALPFALFVTSGIFGLKALGTTFTTEKSKRNYTQFIIALGLSLFAITLVGFGMLFNPGGLQSPSADTVGAEALTSIAGASTLIASIMVTTKLLAASCVGAGVWIAFEARATANKVMFVAERPDFAGMTGMIDAFQKRMADRQDKISTWTAEDQQHAAKRAAFIAACDALCRRYVAIADAAADAARVKALSEIQIAPKPPAAPLTLVAPTTNSPVH